MLNSLILASAFISQMGGYNMLPPAPSPPPRTARPPVPAPAPAPAAPQPAVVAVPGRELKDLPNTTIHYYALAGKNLKAINKSIAEMQQRKDASGRSMAPTTGWEVEATFGKLTHDGQCKVTTAKATFTATANLPRLASQESLNVKEQVAWNNYIARVEATQAASLWFVHDHARDVEKAILASSCEGAQSAGPRCQIRRDPWTARCRSRTSCWRRCRRSCRSMPSAPGWLGR